MYNDFPALEGRPVQQGHANYCAANGHASHTVDGKVQEICPRCGEVVFAPTTCIDPKDTLHEHCPNHGCVEYVCCLPVATPAHQTLDPKHVPALAKLQELGEGYWVESSNEFGFHSSTLRAMERRGLVTLSRKTQSSLHCPTISYTIARITPAGAQAIADHQPEIEGDLPADVEAILAEENRADIRRGEGKPLVAPVEWPALAGALDAGDRLLEVDGIRQIAVSDSTVGLLVESVRHTNSGDFAVTVWGATRMFEMLLDMNTPIRMVRDR